MAQGKEVSGQDIVNWMNTQPEGFHGILRHPDGSEGFVSKDGGAFSFYAIGEGQNAVEVMEVAKQLHDALVKLDASDLERLEHLGEEVRRLAQPKVSN